MKTTTLEENAVLTGNGHHVPALKSGQGVKFLKTITIKRPVSEVYNFWRNLENLPRFMTHLESVKVHNRSLSHWVVKAHEETFEWDAEIFENRVDDIISWQSLPGGDVDNAGTVRFTSIREDRHTVVKVTLKYSPPGGKLAVRVSEFFGRDAAPIIEEDLGRFKSLLEKGEIPPLKEELEEFDKLNFEEIDGE